MRVTDFIRKMRVREREREERCRRLRHKAVSNRKKVQTLSTVC